jgi:hypothetical protein
VFTLQKEEEEERIKMFWRMEAALKYRFPPTKTPFKVEHFFIKRIYYYREDINYTYPLQHNILMAVYN